MRREIDAELKAEVALEALRERVSVTEIARYYRVHPSQIHTWKKQLRENAVQIFVPQTEREAMLKREIEQLNDQVTDLMGEVILAEP